MKNCNKLNVAKDSLAEQTTYFILLMMKLLSLKEIKIDYISCQFSVLHTHTMDICFECYWFQLLILEEKKNSLWTTKCISDSPPA